MWYIPTMLKRIATPAATAAKKKDEIPLVKLEGQVIRASPSAYCVEGKVISTTALFTPDDVGNFVVLRSHRLLITDVKSAKTALIDGLGLLSIGSAKDGVKAEVIKPTTLVRQFNQATIELRDLDDRVKTTRQAIVDAGLAYLIGHNCEAETDSLSSVKITDDSGEAARLSFQDRYRASDPEIVSALFDSLSLGDINEYVHEVMAVAIDNKMFLRSETDISAPTGLSQDELAEWHATKPDDFSELIYLKVVAAVATVARQFGKADPMSATKKVMPKPNFHRARWKFSVDQNKSLFEVLPNTVTLTANVTP